MGLNGLPVALRRNFRFEFIPYSPHDTCESRCSVLSFNLDLLNSTAGAVFIVAGGVIDNEVKTTTVC